MKFEALIAIGTAIYIVVSVMKSVSSMKKKEGDTKSSAGWMDMIKDILAEIEKANNPSQPPPLPGKPGAGRSVPSAGTGSKTAPPKTGSVKTPPVTSKEKTREPVSPSVPPKPSVQSVLPPTPPRETAQTKNPFRKASRKKIREAIIWNEILSPPLSLRDH